MPAAEKRLSMINSKQTLRTLNNVHRKKAAVEAEDYDVAKALKQDIERLRLAGGASPSGRAPKGQVSGQPGGQRGGGHAHEQVGVSCEGHISLYYYYYYCTLFLPAARCVCRQAAVKAAKILLLDGFARSKQDPINRGHGAQCL